MASSPMVRRASLRWIVEHGVERVLAPAGFAKAGKLSWVRREPELEHVVTLWLRRGVYLQQWGVVSPEVSPILWGKESVEGDVSDAVMTGTPSSIHRAPGAKTFKLESEMDRVEVEELASRVASDMAVVEKWLRAFRTRRELREYLLLNREEKDRRGWLVPMNLPLKLYIAAALAIVDGDPVGCELMDEAALALAPLRGEPTDSRMRRLREAAAAIDRSN